jgi:ssDNA-binding Zn-finger/Zn-ribbon topoisomerase 1
MSTKTKGAKWDSLKDKICPKCNGRLRPYLTQTIWACDDYEYCGKVVYMTVEEVEAYQDYRETIFHSFQSKLRRNEK